MPAKPLESILSSSQSWILTPTASSERPSINSTFTSAFSPPTTRCPHGTDDQQIARSSGPRSTRRRERPTQTQAGRTRKQYSEQGRLETAAVREAGACDKCRKKKTKCRHTVKPEEIAAISQQFGASASPSTSTRRSTASSLYPQDTGHWPPPSGYRDGTLGMVESIRHRQPALLAPCPPLGAHQTNTPWSVRRNLTMSTLENTNNHFPLDSPTNFRIFNSPEDPPISGDFESLVNFAMEGCRPSLGGLSRQVMVESNLENSLSLPYDPLDCTGSQFNQTLESHFPHPQPFTEAGGNSLTTVWNGSNFDSHPVPSAHYGNSQEANHGGLGDGKSLYDHPQEATGSDFDFSSLQFEADAEYDPVNFDDEMSASAMSLDYSTTYSSRTAQTKASTFDNAW